MKKAAKNSKEKYIREIQDFLKKKKEKSYKKKEISRALGVSKEDYFLFREALTDLAQTGKIARVKGGKFSSGAPGQGGNLQKVQGVLQITRKGFGFVTDESGGDDIFIAAQNLGTAFNGDLVEVQLFAFSGGRSKEGRITQVISRSRSAYVGTYHKSEYYGFVVPDDPKIYRDFYIQDKKAADAQHGQKVVVEFEKWESSQLNPEGRIVEVLGFPDEPGVDVASVAKGFGLPLTFHQTVLQEAEDVELKITQRELVERLDLRDWDTVTIDPVDAKDFDDAISLTTNENGNYILGVHIADVSHFVEPGSVVDKEAFERGTSIYLVDRVIPMLPEHLSNKICSLQPGEERLTYSCIMELTPEGKLIEYEIRKSVIINKRRFTYEEVQAIVDDENAENPFAPMLKEMEKFSQLLRKKRLDSGSIDFDTPEVKFRLDEKGQPVEIIPVNRLHSHMLVEEFMLLANQTVTQHIQKIAVNDKPYPFIYRVHEKPDEEKVQRFQDFLKALGYNIRVKKNLKPSDFQKILKEIEGTRDEILVKEVALRTMMKAVYSPNNSGHFGLAFDYYTHFTSPIRRYPDLQVHRLLKEYEQPINHQREQELKELLKRICTVSSERERLAMEAERESVKIKQIEWISRHLGEEFEGLISGVAPFGFWVEIIPYLIEGLVHIESLNNDVFIYDEKTYSLIGTRTAQKYRLGDAIKVKVARVNREQNTVDFLLAPSEKTETVEE